MGNRNWRTINRREFLEISAKTTAVVVIASTVPASISRSHESSPDRASDVPEEKRGRSMERPPGNNYYLSKRSELLKGHDKGSKSLKKILASRFDDDHTNTILMEAHREFESIIPEIPYICVSVDGVFSKAFNRGLVRTMTLAECWDRCDFRYKRGRETFLLPLKDGWPPQFRKH